VSPLCVTQLKLYKETSFAGSGRPRSDAVACRVISGMEGEFAARTLQEICRLNPSREVSRLHVEHEAFQEIFSHVGVDMCDPDGVERLLIGIKHESRFWPV
jgi:hypothetical protein